MQKIQAMPAPRGDRTVSKMVSYPGVSSTLSDLLSSVAQMEWLSTAKGLPYKEQNIDWLLWAVAVQVCLLETLVHSWAEH